MTTDSPRPVSQSHKKWQSEKLHDSFGTTFRVEKLLFEEQTEHQHLLIFENETYGRIMMLDDIVQLTLADEFIYHEMMAHMPLFAHPDPQNILIIGGGDGGVAREVLRHKNISSLTLCELDQSVITMGQKYFPEICQDAFSDKRMKVVIQDGTKFVATSTEKFDIILVDSTDPIGPGAVLFTEKFYRDCANILTRDGILVTQNGVPFLQPTELRNSMSHFQKIFSDHHAFIAPTPTYVGGFMAYGWGCNDKYLRRQDLTTLQARFQKENFKTRYYNPEIHFSAFALPNYIKDCLS